MNKDKVYRGSCYISYCDVKPKQKGNRNRETSPLNYGNRDNYPELVTYKIGQHI